MPAPRNASRKVRISRRLYRQLLFLYPRRFRKQYGPAMEQLFGDQCRDAREMEGRAGLGKLWLRVLVDVAISVCREHASELRRAISQPLAPRPASTLDTDMKTTRILGLAAIVVFAISHFLPALMDLSGLACFGYCWNVLSGHDNGAPIFAGAWFYYSGFVISNFLFIGLVFALFVTKKARKFRSLVSVVCCLQALSWLVLNVISERPSQIADIKIGYYVWLIGYGLLVAAHLRKESVESLGSIPVAH